MQPKVCISSGIFEVSWFPLQAGNWFFMLQHLRGHSHSFVIGHSSSSGQTSSTAHWPSEICHLVVIRVWHILQDPKMLKRGFKSNYTVNLILITQQS